MNTFWIVIVIIIIIVLVFLLFGVGSSTPVPAKGTMAWDGTVGDFQPCSGYPKFSMWPEGGSWCSACSCARKDGSDETALYGNGYFTKDRPADQLCPAACQNFDDQFEWNGLAMNCPSSITPCQVYPTTFQNAMRMTDRVV